MESIFTNYQRKVILNMVKIGIEREKHYRTCDLLDLVKCFNSIRFSNISDKTLEIEITKVIYS